jgi:hypothetical protein
MRFNFAMVCVNTGLGTLFMGAQNIFKCGTVGVVTESCGTMHAWLYGRKGEIVVHL